MTIGVVHIVAFDTTDLVARCGQVTQGHNKHYRATVSEFINEAYNTQNEFTNCAKCDATLTDCDHINATEV